MNGFMDKQMNGWVMDTRTNGCLDRQMAAGWLGRWGERHTIEWLRRKMVISGV